MSTTTETTYADLYAKVLRTLRSYGRGTPNLYNLEAAVSEIAHDYGLIDIEAYHPVTGRELISSDEFWAIMRRHAKRPATR